MPILKSDLVNKIIEDIEYLKYISKHYLKAIYIY